MLACKLPLFPRHRQSRLFNMFALKRDSFIFDFFHFRLWILLNKLPGAIFMQQNFSQISLLFSLLVTAVTWGCIQECLVGRCKTKIFKLIIFLSSANVFAIEIKTTTDFMLLSCSASMFKVKHVSTPLMTTKVFCTSCHLVFANVQSTNSMRILATVSGRLIFCAPTPMLVWTFVLIVGTHVTTPLLFVEIPRTAQHQRLHA